MGVTSQTSIGGPPLTQWREVPVLISTLIPHNRWNPILEVVEGSVHNFLWEKASQHYLGEGLQSGPAEVSFKLLHSLRRQGANDKAGMLECIL